MLVVNRLLAKNVEYVDNMIYILYIQYIMVVE